MGTHETNGDYQNDRPEGVLGAPCLDREIDKDGRAALMVWREQSELGRVHMLTYLDEYRGGPSGFASDLNICAKSKDDRVKLGALKLEAQLREWGTSKATSIHVGDVNQTLTVETGPADMGKWLADIAGRLSGRNGHEKSGG